MSLQRSLIPVTRSSRLIVKRGSLPHRVLNTRSGAIERRPGVGLAVASTLGLSLAAYYTLVANHPLHADRPPDRAYDEGRFQALLHSDDGDDSEIHALRSRKSIDSFALGTARDVEGLLKRYEKSHFPPASSGVARYDITQVASNDPLEDDHAEAFLKSGDSHWSFFAVLDGHSGWETSALLREELIETVINELADTRRGNTDSSDSSDRFAECISRAFRRLDDKIVHENVKQALRSKSRSVAVNLLAPAYAGACALLAFYEAESSELRIALTGDCRAVLGRKREDGKYELEVLTADQTGFNVEEKKRVEEAHPGETVVKDGRTMGFGPSRVFGDARWKWSREIQEKLRKSYLGRSVPDAIKTPPYFTAEPVVKTTKVQPGDFVVLATDGLWECLTNREVVGLVGEWVRKREGDEGRGGGMRVMMREWRDWLWGSGGVAAVAESGAHLPVVGRGETKKAVVDDSTSVRYQQWGAKKKFVTVDANAATHLVRNALGGADGDLREALMSMRSPRARVYWDDITATVVFFGRR